MGLIHIENKYTFNKELKLWRSSNSFILSQMKSYSKPEIHLFILSQIFFFLSVYMYTCIHIIRETTGFQLETLIYFDHGIRINC